MERKLNVKIIIPILIIIIGIIMGGLLLSNQYYNKFSLIGEWVSEETGKTVEFTDYGVVKVDGKKAGDYTVTGSGGMIYTIEGHTFEMIYKIDGRNLIWGLPDEEERFERKGLL